MKITVAVVSSVVVGFVMGVTSLVYVPGDLLSVTKWVIKRVRNKS